jgi:flagellar FliL protein
MILLVLLAKPIPDGGANVTLDDERLQDEVPKGLQKVELDLDDALFLEFEEKEEAPPPAPEPAPEPEPEAAALVPQENLPASKSRKKLWVLGIAAALCLIAGAGGSYFFMKSAIKEPEAKHQPEEVPVEQAAPEPEPQNATPKPPELVTYNMAKFQIEYAQADQIRFLTCSMSIPNVTPLMRLEMQAKTIPIRDGIYRYLKNAPLSFLDNPNDSDKLKADLATVINQHMKSGKVSEILIEEYVVR